MKRTLQGHSLIETLSSLALLGLVFMLGMTLVGRLMGPASPPQRFQARALVSAWLDSPVEAGSAAFEEKKIKSFRLERELKPYEGPGKLMELQVRCYRNDKLIEQASRLVLAP